MKKWLCVQILLVSAMAIGSANAPHVTMTPQQMHEDLQRLRSALDEGLPTYNLYKTKAELHALFDQIITRFSKPARKIEFMAGIREILAAVSDAHTVARPANQWLEGQWFLPFKVQIVGDRMLVVRDYGIGPAYLNAEIVSMDGRTAARVIETIQPWAITDGDNTSAAGQLMSESLDFSLAYAVGFGLSQKFEIQFRKKGSEQLETTKIKGISYPQLQKAYAQNYGQEQREAIRLEWHEDTPVLVFENFGQPMVDNMPTSQWIAEAFTRIEERNADNLIIDLSTNGGGNFQIPSILAAHLSDKPIRVLKRARVAKKEYEFFRHCSFAPPAEAFAAFIRVEDGWWDHPEFGGEIQPASPGFHGRVFILTDPINHSATTLFINAMVREGRAVLVGEEVMGAFHRFSAGIGAELILEHSEIRVMVPVMEIIYPEADTHAAKPDHLVTPTYEDVINRRRPKLDYALTLIRNSE